MDWIIPEKLAKSSMPDYSDLVLWKEEGINSIVNLLEEWYKEIVHDEIRIGFNVLHSPIPDFDAPTLDQLHKIVLWIESETDEGRKVLVHCYAGIGRTGTVLTAYLLYKGKNLQCALNEVCMSGAVPQSDEQRDVLEDYCRKISRD